MKLPISDLIPSPLRRWILRRFVSPRTLLEGLEISSGPKHFVFLLALVDKPADAFFLVYRTLAPDRTWLCDPPLWLAGCPGLAVTVPVASAADCMEKRDMIGKEI
jgi:hypothetical protein